MLIQSPICYVIGFQRKLEFKQKCVTHKQSEGLTSQKELDKIPYISFTWKPLQINEIGTKSVETKN